MRALCAGGGSVAGGQTFCRLRDNPLSEQFAKRIAHLLREGEGFHGAMRLCLLAGARSRAATLLSLRDIFPVREITFDYFSTRFIHIGLKVTVSARVPVRR